MNEPLGIHKLDPGGEGGRGTEGGREGEREGERETRTHKIICTAQNTWITGHAEHTRQRLHIIEHTGNTDHTVHIEQL